MPFPLEYSKSRDDFYAFLIDAREEAVFGSCHQAYTMVQGVFQTFRRRLSIRDAIMFCNVLPVGMRALFVADWNVDEPTKPFTDRESMNQEVKELRPKHNFSPDSSITYVARALWRHVDKRKFQEVLSKLPSEASEFWAV